MAPGTRGNGRIDKQIEETFPASDPPSFMGGEVLGAPPGRSTPSPRRPAAKSTHKERRAAKKPAVKKKIRATKKKASR
jgi:hypothetical protein